jgi:hypothetical protein
MTAQRRPRKLVGRFTATYAVVSAASCSARRYGRPARRSRHAPPRRPRSTLQLIRESSPEQPTLRTAGRTHPARRRSFPFYPPEHAAGIFAGFTRCRTAVYLLRQTPAGFRGSAWARRHMISRYLAPLTIGSWRRVLRVVVEPLGFPSREHHAVMWKVH